MSGQDASGRGMAAYVRDGFGAFRQPKFECGCFEMLVCRVCGARQNLYEYSLYRNNDLDDRIFDCLLASIAAVQTEVVRASFLFVGDLNGHHREWLGSTTTNRHGVAAFDFATVSGCEQLVIGPTDARGGTLDLLMTDVPERISFPAGFTLCTLQPCNVIHARNKDKAWFDDQCSHAFGIKQEAHLRWTRDRSRVSWEEFVRCQVRANETYSEAERQFNDRSRDVLMNVQSTHMWWSTLKSAVFGSSSSLPPLVSEGGGLVCESVGKADLLSDQFDSKLSREAVDLPLPCHTPLLCFAPPLLSGRVR